ncbi:MAG: alpha-1,4-glucan--maltose-1-phosphate maltosyltransferase, partial [Erythrobacter sp.]|nr:alpha-1,4-glucan--maltose-1-phosphate maltosyltransferase [Erythrobacter sp.]
NPPKKYQDIVNVDFYGPDAVPDLWLALRDVVLLWVSEGVKVFRVDNPHTKPFPFWEWMIREVRAAHPDVIFLSEAFTRPKVMYRLAKVGFSQSYTYFTWRNSKAELTEYIEELTNEAPKDFFRPHFFVNTPDINPVFLQTGGRPAHRIRAVLAATLSGLWGVYSGFELCDAAPLPGKEEYADSEKYEVRPREWRAPGDIVEDVKLLNRLRRGHPALQTHLNTRFYPAHDENVIFYGKPSADGSDMILVMVSMDPHADHACDFELPLWEFGQPDDGTLAVEDLASGERFHWQGKHHHIHLTPDEPYRIWRIQPTGGAHG